MRGQGQLGLAGWQIGAREGCRGVVAYSRTLARLHLPHFAACSAQCIMAFILAHQGSQRRTGSGAALGRGALQHPRRLGQTRQQSRGGVVHDHGADAPVTSRMARLSTLEDTLGKFW